MSDLINRQKAIAAIDEFADKIYRTIQMGATYPKKEWFDGMANAVDIIKTLPFEEFGWIPVTERPPQYGNYLISFLTDEEPDIGTYNQKTGLWSACDADGFYYLASRGLEVVAWKPLPRPYKVSE